MESISDLGFVLLLTLEVLFVVCFGLFVFCFYLKQGIYQESQQIIKKKEF